MGLAEVEEDDVGPQPGLDPPDPVVDAQRPRASGSRHRQGLARRDDSWVTGVKLVDERRQSGFLHHVQVVVAGGAVGAHSHHRARRQQARNRGRA